MPTLSECLYVTVRGGPERFFRGGAAVGEAVFDVSLRGGAVIWNTKRRLSSRPAEGASSYGFAALIAQLSGPPIRSASITTS